LVRRDDMLQSLSSSLLAAGAVASVSVHGRDGDSYDGDRGDTHGKTGQRYSRQQQQQQRQLAEFSARCAAELRPITQARFFGRQSQ
jgi:hypothetical protein